MNKKKISKDFLWILLLIFSFAYENPIARISGYDRLNPRFFDLIILYGLLFVLPKYLPHFHNLPKYLKYWFLLVAWFAFCCTVWALILPKELAIYSVYRLLKYIEGLVPIFILGVRQFNQDEKKYIRWALLISGLFVSSYSLMEHYGFINNDGILGPYGESYFQIAQIVPIYYSICLFSFLFRKSSSGIFLFLISLFIAYPILLSGSRTGLAFIPMIILCSFLYLLYKRLRLIKLVAYSLIILMMAIVYYRNIELVKLPTISRAISLEYKEADANDIMSRLSYPMKFDYKDYQAGWKLFVIGAGFYIAPKDIGFGYFIPRIDYGYHSLFIFPLEQAGLIGFIIFTVFIVSVSKAFFCYKIANKEDLLFNASGFSYFVSMLVIGIGGHNFWQGFASGNANTLILLFIILALKSNNGTT